MACATCGGRAAPEPRIPEKASDRHIAVPCAQCLVARKIFIATLVAGAAWIGTAYAAGWLSPCGC